jgi:hypothetical protein
VSAYYRTANLLDEGNIYWVYTQMGTTNQLYLAVLVERLNSDKGTADVIICGNGTRLTIPYEDLKVMERPNVRSDNNLLAYEGP